ncbi:GntR family transcriptional regulator [Thermoactinomyces sp. DSM 45892]|uniref:GntR family transcriptional regulator n=1 Tax=Thermoactinomyces sp. DSM 45892 TaxID=1882753 RepID=UPI00089B4236|nr:GntR family transcriptional regulator [Thermoactinomyces sp. DSM 45892]SDY93073.1 transcriptional regulator, GntR family [Thermoactinomyces sp. DSM 45892]
MQLPIQVKLDHPMPIYQQIQDQLSQLILSGQLPPGSPLPSIRALAINLSCSIITTKRAYQELEQKGLIVVKQGRGTFVSSLEEIDVPSAQQKEIEKAIQELFLFLKRIHASPEKVETIFMKQLHSFQKWHLEKTEEDT